MSEIVWLIVYLAVLPFAIFAGLVYTRVRAKRDHAYPFNEDYYGIAIGLFWPISVIFWGIRTVFGGVPRMVANAADETAERITAEPSDDYLLRPSEHQ